MISKIIPNEGTLAERGPGCFTGQGTIVDISKSLIGDHIKMENTAFDLAWYRLDYPI